MAQAPSSTPFSLPDFVLFFLPTNLVDYRQVDSKNSIGGIQDEERQ